MAEHQVDPLLGHQLTEVAEVALETGDPIGDTFLVGPPGERGEGVGAGVDDGDPVATRGHPDGEPTGAAADVEDDLVVACLEQLAHGVPHHGGPGGGTAFDRAVHGGNPRVRGPGWSRVLIPSSPGSGATAGAPPRR